MWNEVLALYKGYVGTGMVAVLFLCAVVYLLITEKDKNVKITFVYVPIILLLLYFNPLFAKVVYSLAGEEIYYRILWLLPVTPVLACTCVRLIQQVKEGYRWALGCAFAVMVMLSGSLVYTSPYFSWAENQYHMPQEVVEICDAIEVEGREVMAVFPAECIQYVRQYSPVVCMPYGREELVERWGFNNELFEVMEAEVIDVGRASTLAKEKLCHYIVVNKDKELSEGFEEYGYKVFDKIGSYVIYVDDSIYRGL